MFQKDFCKSSTIEGYLEETDSNGVVRKYKSGRVLGKVYIFLFREGLPNVF